LPISELRLSTRVENYLEQRRGIVEIGELAGLTEQEILLMPGLGAACLAEIKQALGMIGLKLRPNPES
jgi:DNA-directed RNA polymerase alpha subunit